MGPCGRMEVYSQTYGIPCLFCARDGVMTYLLLSKSKEATWILLAMTVLLYILLCTTILRRCRETTNEKRKKDHTMLSLPPLDPFHHKNGRSIYKSMYATCMDSPSKNNKDRTPLSRTQSPVLTTLMLLQSGNQVQTAIKI
jgi:hypothetical protein